MTPTRRLAALTLTAGLLGTLAGCGDNPFGRFVSGSGSAQTPSNTATATESSSMSGMPVGSESPTPSSDTDSMSPGSSESPSTGPSATSSTDTASPTPGTTGPSTGAGTSGTSTGSPSASTGQSSPQGGVVQVDGRTIQNMPVGVAFPERTRIEATSGFANGGGSVVMSAPGEAQLFSYYRSALPGAGYRIVSDTAGVLAFSGRGYRGSVVGTGSGGVLTWSPTTQ